MSPTVTSTDAKPTTAIAGHIRASPARGALPARVASSARAAVSIEDSSTHERRPTTDDKILAALAALTDRMAKMESSQRVRDDQERIMGAVESGMFASALGANARARPMTIDALTDSPERKPAAQWPRTNVPVDYLRHAEKLAHFAQSIELGSGAIGREVVAVHVDSTRKIGAPVTYEGKLVMCKLIVARREKAKTEAEKG